jgi:hypothetical protein
MEANGSRGPMATHRSHASPPRRCDPANRVDQLVLADNPIAVANEVNEQIEHLRLGMNNCAGTPLLPPRDIDLEIGEAEFQSGLLAAAANSESPRSDDLSDRRRLSQWQPYTALQRISRQSPKRFKAGCSSASSLSPRLLLSSRPRCAWPGHSQRTSARARTFERP